MLKRIDGKELSNLEKMAFEWLDFIVETNIDCSSKYRVSDGTTFYTTSDGELFTDLKVAQSHEKDYLLMGYKDEIR